VSEASSVLAPVTLAIGIVYVPARVTAARSRRRPDDLGDGLIPADRNEPLCLELRMCCRNVSRARLKPRLSAFASAWNEAMAASGSFTERKTASKMP